MNLAGLDLNLLLVFDAVMAERNVTRAGRRIGMSQPAVSNALNRLRHHLKDELFVRTAEGMRPTPRALELAEPIQGALGQLQSALDRQDFDPATARRTFRIATTDYIVSILMPALAGYLMRYAPGVDLRILPIGGRLFEMLDAQEADFGITTVGDAPDRFERALLFEEEYVCLMHPHNSLAEGTLTIPAFAAARHLLITPRGDARGFIDEALASRGLTRRIAMTVNQFALAAPVVAASDLIVTLPRRIANLHALTYGLKTVACPISTPRRFRVGEIVWHRRLGRHPANDWLRDLLIAIAAET